MRTINHGKCPFCNSDKINLYINTKDYLKTGETFDIYRCEDCHLVFTRDVPSEEDIDKYYESEDYISHTDIKKGLINWLYHQARRYMLRRKAKLISRLTNRRNLLDIGCGTGYFPGYMKEKGYHATGVEKNSAARLFGEKKFGLTICTPEEFLADNRRNIFDIITLWHVLEHIYDPNLYLEKIRQLLKNDGVLFVALPNHDSFDARHYGSYWAGYDVPRHLWHFTPETLGHLAEKHNFQIVNLKGLPFDPFFNALLSEKYKDNRLYFITGFFIGLIAFFKGIFRIKKASSIIYVLKKIIT